jgi:probable selenium-dependent hydroxylase accessory protein YqeC
MLLKEAFGLEHGAMVSLIGAGGKTTTLFRLAKEFRDDGQKVLVTTTTKIFKPTKPHVDRLFLVQEADALLAATAGIKRPAVIGAGYNVDDEGKLLGMSADWLDRFRKSEQFDAILIEADGAASRLLKVPSEIEPVVPALSDVTIWIMAIKVIGKPLNANSIHRVERAISILSVAEETPVTPDHIIQLVNHPSGCLRGVPPSSRKIALINQAESNEEIDTAHKLAEALLKTGFDRAVIASFLAKEPVKKVIMDSQR